MQWNNLREIFWIYKLSYFGKYYGNFQETWIKVLKKSATCLQQDGYIDIMEKTDMAEQWKRIFVRHRIRSQNFSEFAYPLFSDSERFEIKQSLWILHHGEYP